MATPDKRIPEDLLEKAHCIVIVPGLKQAAFGVGGKSMLESYGYTVLVADDGRSAVELFKEVGHQISVVILDLTMPSMSGEETFRQLRTIRSNVRVILSSGYNEVEAVKRFTGKSLTGFIQKPYTATQLAQKVRDALNERASRFESAGSGES